LEHLNTCLATKLDLAEGDESFITEVFSGCVQYANVLKVCACMTRENLEYGK